MTALGNCGALVGNQTTTNSTAFDNSDLVKTLLQRVLVNLIVFHDQGEILVRVHDQVAIFRRITVNKDQVGVSAFCNHIQIALLIGEARSG